MPPVLAITLGLIGVAALTRWCLNEVHRVNAELDNIRGVATAQAVDRDSLPTLKPDPKTGEYRPG